MGEETGGGGSVCFGLENVEEEAGLMKGTGWKRSEGYEK